MYSNSLKYRLLVVEDDKDIARLIVRTALKCGYEAFAVYDARTIRQVVSHWRPHLITLDLGLPDVEGCEVISGLKLVQFQGEVVIISGQDEWVRRRAGQFARLSGLRMGANLEKPINVAELRDLLTTTKARLFLSLLELAPRRQATETAKAV